MTDDQFIDIVTTDLSAVASEHRGDKVMVLAEMSATGGKPTLMVQFPTVSGKPRPEVSTYLLLVLADCATKMALNTANGRASIHASEAVAELERAHRSIPVERLG